MKVDETINLEQEGFVFCPKSGECYTLNSLGQTILSWIKSGDSVHIIKQKILEQYDVSEAVLDADLEDFIALCVRYRLVEV
ncbi:MAG: PqqD family protein [Paludibacteraceae bacterium]|nr:PqqD family protein [Paludibacteraceae bacterium]